MAARNRSQFEGDVKSLLRDNHERAIKPVHVRERLLDLADSVVFKGENAVPDGDKGDVIVSAEGAQWSVSRAAIMAALNGATLPPVALSGLSTAPTAPVGSNTAQIATTAFVAAAIAALVNSSPSALDTLSELAAALGNDPNFATTVINAITAKAPLASPVFTGNPTAPTPTAGDNDTTIATTAFVQTAVAGAVANPSGAQLGQARLGLLNSTTLRLNAQDGNFILIDGTFRAIPTPGPTIANTALTSSAVNFIYAVWSGSAIVLEASTTGYTRAASGLMVKGDDPRRTLVGVAFRYSDGLLRDEAANRGVLSYFNRRRKKIELVVAGSSTENPTSPVGNEGTFLCWLDDAIQLALAGRITNNAAGYGWCQIQLDGSLVGEIGGGYVAVGGTFITAAAGACMEPIGDILHRCQGRTGTGGVGTATITANITGSVMG